MMVRSLSQRERVGVRGYGLSLGRNPSPGASHRPLPMGEVAGLLHFVSTFADETVAQSGRRFSGRIVRNIKET